MECAIILAVMTLYSTSVMLCYNSETRNSWYYPVVSILIGLCISSMWVTGVRVLDNKERIFFFSLCWAFAVIFVDYVIPLVFFGLNVNKYVVLGSLIVAAGLVIMKLNMK